MVRKGIFMLKQKTVLNMEKSANADMKSVCVLGGREERLIEAEEKPTERKNSGSCRLSDVN